MEHQEDGLLYTHTHTTNRNAREEYDQGEH